MPSTVVIPAKAGTQYSAAFLACADVSYGETLP
jgi:hypothetical protein